MNIPPKYEDVVAQLEASNKLCDSLERSMKNHRHELGLSTGREAALREDLSKLADDYCKRVDEVIALRQRLTVAEQRAGELESAAREMLRIAGIANQGSNAYNRAIINLNAALNPGEEGEGA